MRAAVVPPRLLRSTRNDRTPSPSPLPPVARVILRTRCGWAWTATGLAGKQVAVGVTARIARPVLTGSCRRDTPGLSWGVLDPDQTFRKGAGLELVVELEIGCH